MADFKINIVTDATSTVAGSKQASEALKELGKSGEDSGKRIGEQTDKASGKVGEFKKVVQGLTTDFPVLRQVAMLAMNPITAAATLGAMAFSFFRQRIEEVATSIQSTDWVGYGRKMSGSFDQGKTAAEGMAKAVKEVKERADEATGSSERLMDVFKARMSAEDRLDEARKKYEVARVQASGGDPVQKRRALLEIEERYAERQRTREDEKSRFEIAEQNRKLGNMRAAGDAAKKQVADLQAEQKRIGDSKTVGRRLAADEKNLETVNTDIAANESRIEVLENPASGLNWFWENLELIRRRNQQERLIRQRTGLEKVVEGGRRKLGRSTALEETLGQAESNLGTINSRADGIAGMLPTQEAVAGIESQSRRDVGRVNTGSMLLGAAGEAAENAARLQDEIARSIAQGSGTSKATINLLASWRAQQADFEKRIRQLESRGTAGVRGKE